jgi:hypothetical protein
MSRRPSHRRWPGRRPPNQYKGGHGPPSPAGFTGPGFRQAYRVILPGLEGPAMKQHFNEISSWMVVAAGACGAILGLGWLGPLGAIVGLGAGVVAGGSFVRSNRFHRD